MKINNCIKNLQVTFPEDWYAELEFESREQYDKSLDILFSKLEQVSKDFFLNLNLSVISGEYIEIIDFKKSLEELIAEIDKVAIVDFGTLENEYKNEFINLFLDGFISPVKKSLKYYKIFYNNIIRAIYNTNSYLGQRIF
jgi:hypothetical protein